MNAAGIDPSLSAALWASVAAPRHEQSASAGAISPAAVDLAARVQDELHRRGWVRLRLFEGAEEADEKGLERLLLDVSAGIGSVVPQNAAGKLLGRIEDEGRDYASHHTRGHQTRAALAFHSDRCDVNLLLYVRSAVQGGEISALPYAAAASRLEQADPEAYATLFDGFPFDLREERIFPSMAWHWRPILWQTRAGIRGHYIRRFIEDSQRHPDCPRLTARQTHALDRFDAVLEALRPEHSFSPRPGDLLALDNYRVMHARSSFADDGSQRRLALRTWVAPFASEGLPPFLHPLAGCCEPGARRGGVASAELFGPDQLPAGASRNDHD